MQVKSILNRIQKQPGFVYGHAEFVGRGTSTRIHVPIRARRRTKPVCSGCGKKRAAYDHLKERHYKFVPLWAIAVFLVYAPRRCNCSQGSLSRLASSSNAWSSELLETLWRSPMLRCLPGLNQRRTNPSAARRLSEF